MSRYRGCWPRSSRVRQCLVESLKASMRTKQKAVKGVRKVLEVPSGVAVIATAFGQLSAERDALQIEWDEGPMGRFQHQVAARAIRGTGKAAGLSARKEGDAAVRSDRPRKRLKRFTKFPTCRTR